MLIFTNVYTTGKQAASSMAPLIFLNSTGSPIFATGSSGGLNGLSAIISVRFFYCIHLTIIITRKKIT